MGDRKVLRWVRESSELVYSSEYFRVYRDSVRLPNGGSMVYDWYGAHDFCVIVALVNNRLIVIENYRYPADDWFLELPAGHIEGEETPTQAAARELEEETGYRPGSLSYLHWYYVSSRSLQRGHILFAQGCVKTRTSREESELQRVKLVTPRYFEQKVREGAIRHAATLVAYSVAKSRGLI